MLFKLPVLQSRYWQSLRGLVRSPLAVEDAWPQRMGPPQVEVAELRASSSSSELGSPRVSAEAEHMQVGRCVRWTLCTHPDGTELWEV